MYLGKCDGLDCFVSSLAANSSVLIIGQSGTGKSCRQNQIELKEIRSGNTVVVIDVSQNHRQCDIFKDIRTDYMARCNCINVKKDGLGLEILNPISSYQGATESYVNLVNSNVQALSASSYMGVRQQVVIREAIEAAIDLKRKTPNSSEEDILRSVFIANKKEAMWQNVYQKLWTILNCGVLRPNKNYIRKQAINIFDLSGLDILSAETLAEVILAYLWRMVYNVGFSNDFGGITIILDEFQHVSVKKHSILRTMLCEGRKFGLNLILTTQSLNIFSREELSMLGQTATHLYFRPAVNDLTQCAKMIEASQENNWRKQLSNLGRGECLAVGSLEVNGKCIQHPLRLL